MGLPIYLPEWEQVYFSRILYVPHVIFSRHSGVSATFSLSSLMFILSHSIFTNKTASPRSPRITAHALGSQASRWLRREAEIGDFNKPQDKRFEFGPRGRKLWWASRIQEYVKRTRGCHDRTDIHCYFRAGANNDTRGLCTLWFEPTLRTFISRTADTW